MLGKMCSTCSCDNQLSLYCNTPTALSMLAWELTSEFEADFRTVKRKHVTVL